MSSCRASISFDRITGLAGVETLRPYWCNRRTQAKLDDAIFPQESLLIPVSRAHLTRIVEIALATSTSSETPTRLE